MFNLTFDENGFPITGYGDTFPSGPFPQGMVFYRIDLHKHYWWDDGTKTWTPLVTAGGGAITIEEADGVPSIASATKLSINQTDGLTVADLGGGDARLALSTFTDTVKGAVPASGGGTTNFLRADGTFVAPPGGGGGDALTVNGVAVVDADLDDATPAAPAGAANVAWQKDAASPANVSANVPANAVANTVLADMAANTAKVRAQATLGDPEDLAVGANTVLGRKAGDIVAETIATAQLGDAQVTHAKYQNIATDRLLGRDDPGSGPPTEILLTSSIELSGANSIRRAALTGDVTAAAGSNATTIAADAVTFAKMQNIGTDRLIGRDTAAAGDPEEISLGASLEFTGAGAIQRAALTGDATAAAGANATLVKKASEDFALTGDISPTAITADQNDYSPTGLATASTLRLSSDAARSITGLAGGADGRLIIIHNVNTGAFSLTLVDESASSTAANRFALSANLVLAKDESCTLQYDSTDSRWRLASGAPGAGGGGSTHNLLDGTTHPDTTISAVTRGDLVVGNSTPAWDDLALGADGTVLQSDGLDAVWQTFLELAEISTPSAPEANEIRAFAAGNNAHIKTIDEHGLIDVLSPRDSYRTRRRVGIGVGSDSLAAGADWYARGLQSLAEGTIANTTSSALDGHSKLFTTAATLNTDAGFFAAIAVFERGTNPDVTFKFRVNSTAVRRVWIGFSEGDLVISDSDSTQHKFALRLSTAPAVTGFTIVHGDGTTEVVESQIQASDTAIHTIRLIADNANSRFGYSFDGAAIVWITTNIPGATDDLSLICQIRTLEAVAKNMNFWWMEGTVDA